LFLRDLLATHRGLCQLDLPLLDLHWWPALQKLATLPSTVPLVQGLATRLLFDRERLDLETTSRRLDYALSRGNEPLEVANWIAGFLHGSGLLLLHHPALWRLVDDWIAALDMDEVQAVLPLLRRTFSQFSPRERQQMLHLVQHPPAPETAATVEPAALYREDVLAELLVGVKGWLTAP
jgi:hypothetical protein